MINKKYLKKLKLELTKNKNHLRRNILQGVTKELAEALKKNDWFMSNEYFGVGVFSDGVDDDGRVMESRCYTTLEVQFRSEGMTTGQIVEEFGERYLRQFFMAKWITEGGFQYISAEQKESPKVESPKVEFHFISFPQNKKNHQR
jgi:hypothetical protein